MNPSPSSPAANSSHRPPARSELHSRRYVFPGAESHRRANAFRAASQAGGWSWRQDDLLMGFVPAWYSNRLEMPSLSGSASFGEASTVVPPKKCDFHSSEIDSG